MSAFALEKVNSATWRGQMERSHKILRCAWVRFAVEGQLFPQAYRFGVRHIRPTPLDFDMNKVYDLVYE